jgi:hypothetical protein
MKSISGIVGALICAALLTPSIADARGSGGGGHSSGHSSMRSSADSDNSGGDALPRGPGNAQAPEDLPVSATQRGERETDDGVRDDSVILTNLGSETKVESKGVPSDVDVRDAAKRAK